MPRLHVSRPRFRTSKAARLIHANMSAEIAAAQAFLEHGPSQPSRRTIHAGDASQLNDMGESDSDGQDPLLNDFLPLRDDTAGQDPNDGWYNVPEEPDDDATARLQQLALYRRNITEDERQRVWEDSITKLLPMFIRMKQCTKNWTSNRAYVDFKTQYKLCDCEGSLKRKRWVDLIDIRGQYRREVEFCACMHDIETLLARGYLASTPDRPQTAFSLPFLRLHSHIWNTCAVPTGPYAEAMRLWLEEQSGRLYAKKTNQARCLRRPLTMAVDIYRNLKDQVARILSVTANLSPAQVLADRACPACFGPSRVAGAGSDVQPPPQTTLYVCIDANLQHRHQIKASKDNLPIKFPDLFLPPSAGDDMERYITECEARSNIRPPPNGREPRDPCEESHKAAGDKNTGTAWKGCDDSGLMGICCRHDALIKYQNMFDRGERRSDALALVKEVVSVQPSDRPIRFLYDIGCSLAKFIEKRNLLPEEQARMAWGTSVFHAYVHNWACQVQFNPRLNDGWGLTDGEGLERLWSYLSPLVRPLRYATRNHRLSAIAHRTAYHNSSVVAETVHTLVRKHRHAATKHQAALKEIGPLLNKPNRHDPHGRPFSRPFFADQWAHQKAFERTISTANEARKETLAAILERQLALDQLRDSLLEPGTLTTLDGIMEITDRIATLCAEQDDAIRAVGGQHGNIAWIGADKERLLLLVWSAKTQLFKLAVDLHGVRQPLLNSRSHGGRVGTRHKEKILTAITRRKPAVVKAIKTYFKRNTQYLTKYQPDQLGHAIHKELTYKEFSDLPLDHAFWSDSALNGSQAPWAIDPDVQQGIALHRILCRTQEEFGILQGELKQALSWAVSMYDQWKMISDTLLIVDDLAAQQIQARLPESLQSDAMLPVLHLETLARLHQHAVLVIDWAEPARKLWYHLFPSADEVHPYFDWIQVISAQQARHSHSEEINEILEDFYLDHDATDGEEADDSVICESDVEE